MEKRKQGGWRCPLGEGMLAQSFFRVGVSPISSPHSRARQAGFQPRSFFRFASAINSRSWLRSMKGRISAMAI